MNPARATYRRHLSSSPFNVPEVTTPPVCYEVNDQVTHDKYGLGTVTGIEDGVVLLIDFRSHRRRIKTPCAKLTKL